ncbi:phosphatidylinositol-specific phospholipase C1-like protein [Amycolatopsis samaneae]|uniref:Phosphatidylinositol-specific phospholipase C1-like protein n=1 Tax=Amycolatopsis samaneae TaxID=664691 RepID=A0ABW5GUN8_9PSEU
MVSAKLSCAALAAAVLVGAGAVGSAPAHSAPRPAWGTRLNQVQLVGTHNSYHRELSFAEKVLQGEKDNLWYSHASLPVQLGQQSVRQLELDVMPDDPERGLYTRPLIRADAGLGPLTDPAMAAPGLKVMHWADHDYGTSCATLRSCLSQAKGWSDTNRGHAPIVVLLELKRTDPAMERRGGPVSPPWDARRFDDLDREIRSVFPPDRLITPDTVRRPGLTLEQSVLRHGWPGVTESRGKFLFLMDNKDQAQQAPYLAGRPNLEGRVLFTDSAPGRPDAAFLEENDPTGPNLAKIQDWVRRGYLVRTRADEPFAQAVSGDTTRRDAAFASGAQLVSTDFPAPGMAARHGSDYVVELPGRRPVRCDPVTASWPCLLPPAL